MKPDQFTKMRAGRVRAAAIKWPAQVVEAPRPAMELYGVSYVEATGRVPNDCQGCAFKRSDRLCCEAGVWSIGTFGGDCADRDCIYVEAV